MEVEGIESPNQSSFYSLHCLSNSSRFFLSKDEAKYRTSVIRIISSNHPQVVVYDKTICILMAIYPFHEIIWVESDILAQFDEGDIRILEPVFYDAYFDLAIFCSVVNSPEPFNLT